MNFKSRIALVMIISTFMTIIIISVTSLNIASNTLENRTREFLQTAMISQTSEIDALILAAEKATQRITQEILLSIEASRYLESASYRKQYLDRISSAIRLAAEINSSRSAFAVFFDSKGGTTTKNMIWYADIDRNGIPEAQSNSTLFDRIHIDELIANPPPANTLTWVVNTHSSDLLAVVSPLYINGDFMGLVGSDISNATIKKQLSRATYFNSGTMWLSNDVGTIISHQHLAVGSDELNQIPLLFQNLDTGQVQFKNIVLSSREMTNRLKANPPPIAYLGNSVLAPNPSKMIGIVQLSNKWLLYTAVNQSDVYKGLDKIVFIIVATMLLALLIALVYAYLMARRIAEPYSYLAHKIEAIGRGQFDVQLSPHYLERKDEAGILSRAVESMKNLQADSFNTIKRYNENLEKLVDERTHELSHTNARLAQALTETQNNQHSLETANLQLEAMLHDIAIAKHQLALSEKLASISKVLMGLSHNMNTPLGNAITLVTYLEEKIEGLQKSINSQSLTLSELTDNLEESRHICTRIFDNIGMSRGYIDRITEISYLQSRTTIDYASFYSVAEVQFSLARANFPKVYSELKLDFDPAETCIMPIQAVSTLLYELMVNTLEHGVGKMGLVAENPIIISLSPLEPFKNGKVSFSYTDNGIGMAREDLNDIFTPLYTSKMSSHAGLGLHQVHQLITQSLNGSIDVKIPDSGGLRFDIYLHIEQEGLS